MVWVQIALWVVSLVVSYKLRPKPQAPRPATMEDIPVPTADESRPIPKLYGTKWIRGANILWFGDLSTEAITQRGARKYGIAGPRERITVGYRYFLGLHFGLCHSLPDGSVRAIMIDDKIAWEGQRIDQQTITINARQLFGGDEREGGVSGEVDVCMGAESEPINGYLAAQLGPDIPAFRGISALVAKGVYVGNSPYLKNWSFLVSEYQTTVDIETSAWTFNDTGNLPENAVLSDAAFFNGIWFISRGAVSDQFITRAQTIVDDPLEISIIETPVTVPITLNSSTFFDIGQGGRIICGGLIATNGRVLMSNDLGATWANITTDVGSGNGIVRALVTNGAGVWVISFGSGTIRRSTDNGDTWSSAGGVPGMGLNNCLATNGEGVWIAGESGNVIGRSIDNGASWANISSGSPAPGASSWAGIDHDQGTWIIAGTGGQVMRSTNNGESWTLSTGWPNTDTINSVKAVRDNSRAWLISDQAGHIGISLDDGVTWSQMDTPPQHANALPITAMATDGEGGWIAVGRFRTPEDVAGPVILRNNLEVTERLGPMNGDSNPADIIIDAITNPDSGMGYSHDTITTGEAFGSFDYARDLFDTESLWLSFLQNGQDSVDEFIRSVQEHVDAAVQVDPVTGRWIIVPIRDDYDPDTIPHYSTAEIISVDEFYRPGYGELVNQVTVVFDDTAQAKERAITLHNNAVRVIQGGVNAVTNSYPGITRPDLATRICSRDLRQLSTPLARVSLTMRPEFGFPLRAGSVFRFSWPPKGISGMVLRVVSIDYGDLMNGAVALSCTEDVFATASALYSPPPATLWRPPVGDPTTIELREIEEAPYRLLLTDILGAGAETEALIDDGAGVIMTQARRPSGDSIRYEIHVRESTGEFDRETSTEFTRVLPVTMGQIPQAVESALTFPPGTNLEGVTTGQLVKLGSEWCMVASIADLTVTLRRGVMDTTPEKHAAGTPLWLTDINFGIAETLRYDGDSLVVRLLTIGAGGVQSLEDLDGDDDTPPVEDVVDMSRRALRPYPPGDFQIGGQHYPAMLEITPPLTVTWAHRDRLEQGIDLTAQDAADIGPEAGVTYRLTVTGISGAVLVDEDGITDTSWDLEAEDIPEPAFTIELTAYRDGLESWTAQRAFVMSATGLGYSLGLNLGGRGLVYEVAAGVTGMNPTSAFPAVRQIQPRFGPADGRLYAGQAIIDPDSLAVVHFYARPSPLFSGGESQVFAMHDWVPSIGRMVGVHEFIRIISTTPLVEGKVDSIRTVNPDTYAIEETGVSGNVGPLRYIPELDRVCSLGLAQVRKFDPATWAADGVIQKPPGVAEIFSEGIWEIFYHDPTAIMYLAFPLAGRLYYVQGDSSGTEVPDNLDYVALPGCRAMAYISSIDRIAVAGEAAGVGRLWFIDPADQTVEESRNLSTPGGAARGLHFDAATNRIYVGTAFGGVVIVDVSAGAIEYRVGITAPGLPNPSGGPLPRNFTAGPDGGVYYLNGGYVHRLT